MTARQVINVAYAALTEGLDDEGRKAFDEQLELDDAQVARKENARAMKALMGMGFGPGEVN